MKFKQLEPYDYQEECVIEIAMKVRDKYDKILIQQVTGAGKTVIVSYFIKRYRLKNPSSKLIFLTHRQEICDQAKKTFSDYGLSCRVEMVKTFVNQLKLGAQRFDVVILDEVHHGDFKNIYDHYEENTLIIGVTATPIASDKKQPLKGKFQTIITGLQPGELISKGKLVELVHYVPETPLDKKTFMRGSKISESKMGEQFSKPKLVEGVLDAYKKYCNNEKTVIFNTTKEHCRLVHQCFLDAGLPSFLLISGDGMSEKDRKKIMAEFEATHNGILQNVAIATAGYDHPPIVNAILNFTSDSLVKYLQSSGRAARIWIEGMKKHGRLIDLGGNVENFGRWDRPRDWKDIFYNPGKAGEGVAPMKDCPKCEALIYMSAQKCQYCGHLMPRETVYTDMVVELKLMPDKPVTSNSQTSLDKAIADTSNKIRKLPIPIEEKRDLLSFTVKKIYEDSNWDLKKSKLNLILKSNL